MSMMQLRDCELSLACLNHPLADPGDRNTLHRNTKSITVYVESDACLGTVTLRVEMG